MKRNKKRNIIITLIVCAMLVTSTVAMFFLNKNKPKIEEKNTNKEEAVQQTNNSNHSIAKESSKPVVIKKEPTYIAPESEKVDTSYFDDAVFIGNSRTQGLMLYGGINNAKFYADKGLMINKVFDKPITIMGEQDKDTVVNALTRNLFEKYYIMLGTNELGWAYENVFIEEYQKLIDKIKEINPDGIIYIESILPVSKLKSDNDKVYNNANIENYNNLLKDLAKKNEVYYVNVAEHFKDETGSLDADASSDGIHLKAEYCKQWTEYLMTHTIKPENSEDAESQQTQKNDDDKVQTKNTSTEEI